MKYKLIGGDQKEYGPYSTEEISRWVAERRANGNTLVQAEDKSDWEPLSTVPDLAPCLAATPAMAGSSGGNGNGLQPTVPDYLVPSILACFCLCLPLALPAVVAGSRVQPLVQAGNLYEARATSRRARFWFFMALGAGVALYLMVLLLIALAAGGQGHPPPQ